MKNKVVIFDLDGTLLNTLGDLADACNYALSKRGLPTHSVEKYKNFVGWGITTLIELSLPEDLRNNESVIRDVKEDVTEYYGLHWNVKTKPYDGIVEVLKSFKENNIRMAVLSNKPQEFTEITVNYFFPEKYFFAVEGAKGKILKPMKEALEPIFSKIGELENAFIFFVGDSKIDMETAKAGNIFPIGVSWGFRDSDELFKSGAKFIAHSPSKLKNYILEFNT